MDPEGVGALRRLARLLYEQQANRRATQEGDPYDPIQALAMQMHRGVHNPNLAYDGGDHVLDPSTLRPLQKGHPAPPPQLYRLPEGPIGQPSLGNLRQGLHEEGTRAAQEWHQQTYQRPYDAIQAIVQHIQQAFPHPQPTAPSPDYLATGPSPVDLTRDPLALLIKMMAGSTGDFIPQGGPYRLSQGLEQG